MELLNNQIDDYYNNSLLNNICSKGLLRKIGIQMLSAIKNIHLYGILHRDVKPGNFLMELTYDTIKLIDFGLSKQYIDKNGLPHLVGFLAFQWNEPTNLSNAEKISMIKEVERIKEFVIR